jgi:hypothetical protein
VRVYHFTSAVNAISNLSLQRLKVSKIGELNDPFELLAVDLLDKRHRNAVNSFKEELDRTHGLICFCSSFTNPLVWAHYADRHKGVALGFDIPDDKSIKIIYTEERPTVEFDERLQKIVNSEKVLNHLIGTKFRDWQYEDEIRMYVSIKDKIPESGMVFEEFSSELELREVILGARCELPISGLRRLSLANKTPVYVKKVKMALREFRVVEDRDTRISDEPPPHR